MSSNQEEYYEIVKKKMLQTGWKIDQEDENRLYFSYFQDENHIWFMDYHKKEKRMFYYNSKVKVNLRVTNANN